jgi:DNA repair and recombination protein RAD52
MSERFSTETVGKLLEPLDPSVVKSIKRGGRNASYITGYQAISEANRLFGFGGWDSTVVDLACVVQPPPGETNYRGDGRDGYLVAYTARVRVSVTHADEGVVGQMHEDVGYGEGIEYHNLGQAHEGAVKEAVTDALKRALRHWGNAFGLSLYDKDQRPAAPNPPQQAPPRPTAPAADDHNRPATQEEIGSVREFGDGLGFTVEQSRQAVRDACGDSKQVLLKHIIDAKKKLTEMASTASG